MLQAVSCSNFCKAKILNTWQL